MLSLEFIVNIDTLSSMPENYRLHFTDEERRMIAKRLNLLSLEMLEANLQLQKKEHLYLTGKIIADVTQQCVRTLVPLPRHLEFNVHEEFAQHFTEQEEVPEEESELLIEPLDSNILNLGEIVVQLLSAELDPYPVDPNSSPLDYHENDGSSPFEVLKKRK